MDSDSESYHSELNFFTASSSPMDGTNIDLLFEGGSGSGPISLPPIFMGITTSGTTTIAHDAVGTLPISSDLALATTIPMVPPYIYGRSGPSMTILTILNMRSQPHIPPIMHGIHTPANSNAIVSPSRANLRFNLPFMAHLNLPGLARLTNDPISHQPH